WCASRPRAQVPLRRRAPRSARGAPLSCLPRSCRTPTARTRADSESRLERAHEDLARLRPDLRPDHALVLHVLDDARCPVVADLQPALHVRDRGVARLRDQRDRLVVHLVDVVVTALAVLALRVELDQVLLEARLALLAQGLGKAGDLALGDER